MNISIWRYDQQNTSTCEWLVEGKTRVDGTTPYCSVACDELYPRWGFVSPWEQ